ncbi:MAG: RAMP superfamily CRISPR-associated protein, partial [Dysgonamonadaceae bacterium]|nr:RAMP superfamily CRISPR-associated protein [Dysgonamonadaceae bacterium]
MLTIKAPFNFVPLNDKVFFPEWADKISHDIPFEDGESGEIELKITAHSPIFVRNGHTRVDADAKNAEYTSFSKIGEKYFIPATSVKGAIRNVLEIMSFGKMTQISDDRYSLRDLSLKREYLNFFQNSEIHCGWMIKEDNCIKISDHGIPKRISHRDLDGLWHTKFTDIFRNGELLKNDSNRTALYKIKKAEGHEKRVRYDEFLMNSVNPVDKR